MRIFRLGVTLLLIDCSRNNIDRPQAASLYLSNSGESAIVFFEEFEILLLLRHAKSPHKSITYFLLTTAYCLFAKAE